AEATSTQAEGPYRMLFEAYPQPMWVYDRETLAILAVNQAAVDRYGYGREEFLTLTIKDLRPPEDVPALEEQVAGLGRGIKAPDHWRHRAKSGDVFEVEITSHPIEFEGREARIVLALDITERRRAEQQLRETLSLLSATLESTADGILVVDRD